MPVAAHLTGSADGYTFAAQGNILTSSKVVERMSDAFAASGCDLAERLVLALEAAGEQGEGDSRCTDATSAAGRQLLWSGGLVAVTKATLASVPTS